jgi:hypothetical protein
MDTEEDNDGGQDNSTIYERDEKILMLFKDVILLLLFFDLFFWTSCFKVS